MNAQGKIYRHKYLHRCVIYIYTNTATSTHSLRRYEELVSRWKWRVWDPPWSPFYHSSVSRLVRAPATLLRRFHRRIPGGSEPHGAQRTWAPVLCPPLLWKSPPSEGQHVGFHPTAMAPFIQEQLIKDPHSWTPRLALSHLSVLKQLLISLGPPPLIHKMKTLLN